MSSELTPPLRRTGAETRALIRRTALRLFTEQGYDATSLRQIADELGINKASLYYYFDSKQAILEALFDERGDEAEALIGWLKEQRPAPDLLERAVLRWVDAFSTAKLQGIRFVASNPRLAASRPGDASRASTPGGRIGGGLAAFVDEAAKLLRDPSPENEVLLRMSVLSINAAVHASAHSDLSDDAIIAAAKKAARLLLADIA